MADWIGVDVVDGGWEYTFEGTCIGAGTGCECGYDETINGP